MRLDGIDILRGIAVISVVLYHFFVLLGLTDSNAFPYVRAFGSLGVPLFFVISGYLIYRSIERSIEQRGMKQGLLNYAFHRLFRILPAYYFNLLIVFLVAAFVINHDYFYSASLFRQFFTHLTFTSYFIHKSAGFGINGAYWTLNIEMLWYIVVPLFFIFFRKTGILLFIMLMSLFYIWSVGIGFFDPIFNLNSQDSNYRLLHNYYITQLPGQINYLIAFFTLIVFVGAMGYFNIYLDFLPSHLALLSGATLLFILLYTTKVKGGDFLEWIGKISYSLYLWHMPILFVMQKSNILEYRSIFEAVIFFLILLFSISSMSYYFIEEGGFALRKKVTKRFFTDKNSNEVESR